MRAQHDRQIRVFISSTFRDMGAERDYLVKFIFPQLRKLCESRGVIWGEVDLRWGVTDEAAADGKVLPICLEEIRRCQPYFIGLLGERYGWVPESVPMDLIEREPWLKEHITGLKSVTELEILHGVLNNPSLAGHAFFYLRDPAFVESVPRTTRSDFTTEDSASKEKLRLLKQQIRASGFPVRENCANPEELGELVLADLTKVINESFPEGSQPDPLDRETMEHEAFAQSRARVYIGRDEYFQQLDAHACGTDARPLVILGESGSGKSALLANWALRYRASHPGEFLLLHFIGGSPYSSDWAAMLRRIMGEFARRFSIVRDIPEHPDALRATFKNLLHIAAAKARIILVIDALNQLEDRDGAPDLVWLSPVMPENVRLIVSTLPGRALDEINKREWTVLHVQALDPSERLRFITDYLAQYTKALGSARAARIAGAPQSANPLYLRALLEELRLFGEHERLDERITHYLESETIPELYGKILARWESDYGGGGSLVRDSMTLLWAARRGLTETELLQALGKNGEPMPRAQWSPLFLAVGDSLVSRGGLLTFFHDYLREAVRNAYLPTEDHRQSAHLRLADHFASQSAAPAAAHWLARLCAWLGIKNKPSNETPATRRQLDELPWQLAEAGVWPRLLGLFSDLSFFDSLWEASQFDAKSLWARIEKEGLRMVEAYRPMLLHPGRFDSGRVWRISFLLGAAGHTAEALSLRAFLADHFRQTGNRANLAQCLCNQAEALRTRGDLDGSMALNRESEQLCRELADWDSLSTVLGNQALIMETRGDLDGAMELHREEERICRDRGNKDGLQRALGNQALILETRDDLNGAMALHEQEEQTCRELGDWDALGTCLGNQAVILTACGDLDGAMTLHRQEEQICRELGNKDGLQRALGNMALVLKARGDLKGAMALKKQAEQICRELCNKAGLQASIGDQANILSMTGDLAGAMALYAQQEQLCREMGNAEGLAISMFNQAITLAQKMSRPRDALPIAEEAFRIANEHGFVAMVRQFQPFVDHLHLVLGNP